MLGGRWPDGGGGAAGEDLGGGAGGLPVPAAGDPATAVGLTAVAGEVGKD